MPDEEGRALQGLPLPVTLASALFPFAVWPGRQVPCPSLTQHRLKCSYSLLIFGCLLVSLSNLIGTNRRVGGALSSPSSPAPAPRPSLGHASLEKEAVALDSGGLLYLVQ